ncbi:hypothetical protein QDR37_14755 [Amnibacterium sp. CER49]|nr:hypothetical protein [Amnibacterium sp. CER49]MDH2445210.1 hypothetical protein [Amnibacterium sp. CER49]
MAETTRYYVCPCCGLVRLVPFRATDPAVPPMRTGSRVVAR